MTKTKNNHYNPCFWTAFWNFDYLENRRSNPSALPEIKARNVKVYTLNLKSNKLLTCKTEKIFFQKNAGIAELSNDSVNNALKRMHPTEEFSSIDSELDNIIIDFENHFTMIEESYKNTLEKVVLTEKNIDLHDRVNLATFVAFQLFRNPNSLDNLIDVFKKNNSEKFEVFFTFKRIISDRDSLIKFVAPFLASKMKIYRLSKNVFPLSDNPILIRNFHLMVSLAPNIMLEINLKKIESNLEKYQISNRISFFKYRKFILRTITNSSKEIIFGETKKLLKIQNSKAYKIHLAKIKKVC